MAIGPFGIVAKPPTKDLTSIVNREPFGLTDEVRRTYKEIWHSDSNEGLLGFQIRQFGLLLEAFYKRDDGNNEPSFSITVPNSQPYLRDKQPMKIAEKAHILMLLRGAMSDDRRDGIRRQLYNLEKACFLPESGRILTEFNNVRKFPRGERVLGHVGINFPDDVEYEKELDLGVVAIELVKGEAYSLIDCSRVFPYFIKANRNNPDKKRRYMSRREAWRAIDYIKNTIISDPSLYTLIGKSGLWGRLESSANQSSVDSSPVPSI